jgi:hypothetical protein
MTFRLQSGPNDKHKSNEKSKSGKVEDLLAIQEMNLHIGLGLVWLSRFTMAKCHDFRPNNQMQNDVSMVLQIHWNRDFVSLT